MVPLFLRRFLKLSLAGFKTAPLLIVAALSTTTYINYVNEKTPGNEQFDFVANDISESEIVLDGDKDMVYSPMVVDFGVKTGSVYDCQLYTYHGDQALYLFFDVNDRYVTKRAIGSNNAQDEDGVEISMDCLINGGSTPQTDDLRMCLGVSGFVKVLRGTGTGWGTSEIGFGGSVKTKLKPNTTPNDNSDIDEGYTIEYRIPYGSIFGEADKNTPFAFAFVHSTLNDVTASRSRTGMSGHPTYKIPTADNPGSFPVLTGDDKLHTRASYNNLNQNMPTVLGKVTDVDGHPINNATAIAYYKSKPSQTISTHTDKTGYFTFEDIKTDDDFIVTVKRAGYIDYQLVYDSANLVNANGAEYYQEFLLLEEGTTTTISSGSITAPGLTNLSGFKVSVLGYSSFTTNTDADGNFSINVYSGINNTLVVEKSGYEKAYYTVSASELTGYTINLFRNVVSLAEPVKTTLLYNYAKAGISRTNDSIYLKAQSPYVIKDSDILSLYINSGNKSSFSNDFSNGDYRVDYSNGSANVYHYSESTLSWVLIPDAGATITSKVSLKVLYETELLIPNATLGLTSSDIFGAAVDFFDGENYQENYIGTSFAKDGEIETASTATYLRFDNSGAVYFSNNNLEQDFLYYYHGVDGAANEDIPNNADRIYMTYERDNDGVEMDIVVSGDFGTHFNTNTNIAGPEAINVLFNIDGVNGTAWALYTKDKICYDINLRIYSDDTLVYINSTDVKAKGSDQMWWSDAGHNNGVAKNFTLNARAVPSANYVIEKHPGYSVYKLIFTYADLLALGGAPSGAVLDGDSEIGACLFEVSETSKTTIRFYTNSGDAWVYKNKALLKTIGAFSVQTNYASIEKNI